MREGVWKNGRKKVTGFWRYNWASDSFTVLLNSKDPITGEGRRMTLKGDSPEWGNWKLVREKNG